MNFSLHVLTSLESDKAAGRKFLFNLRIVVLFIGLLSFVSGICIGQIDRVRFDQIGQREGLEQLRIYSIVQDEEGFIWFGTQDGLVKYDGYEFRVFTFDPGNAESLADNFINNLALGHDGKIWIGTESGAIDAFDPRDERFLHYALGEDISLTRPIEHLYVDLSGSVYVSLRGGGFYRLEKGQSTFSAMPSGPENEINIQAAVVQQTLVRHDDEMWLSVKDVGPARYDSLTGTLHFLEGYDAGQYGDAVLYELSDGTLLIGTWGAGIFAYDDGENLDAFSISVGGNSERPMYIKKILQNLRGDLWIATAQSGIWFHSLLSGDTRRYFHDTADPFSLVSNDIEAMYEDRSETLWLGTLNGISKFNRFKNKFHFQRLDQRGTRVLSIHEDQTGELWLGTYLHGLARIDADGLLRPSIDFVTQPPSARNTVYSIEMNGTGEILVGTADQGVFTIAQGQRNPRQASVPMHISDILRDGYGSVWLATSVNGLCRYHAEGGRVEAWSFDVPAHYQDRLHDAVVLFEDSRRYLWVGTEGGGVLRLHPDRRTYDHFHRDPDSQSDLSDDRIVCFVEDRDGAVWIGTRKGLNRFDSSSGSFTQFYIRDGLANDAILALLVDGQGDIWASTNSGLTRIDLPTVEMRSFGTYDGLEGVEFIERACQVSGSGELLFGTNDGLIRFHPANLEDNPHQPRVLITSNTVLDRTQQRGREFAALDDLRLAHHENYFSFEFAALDFAETNANRFAYMLEGADKDWVYAGNRRSASYIQVPPGNYVFRVKAANNDGLWNDENVAVRITILPPFWETNEFRAAMVVLMITAVFAAYKIRTSSIRRQRNLLQREVGERRIAEQKLLANRARLRSLANQLTLAEEKERRRISVALHEKIGHALLLAKVKMRDQFERATTPKDEQSIQDTIALLEDTIRHTRTMTVEISPPSLHQFGIEAATESLLERFGKEYAIRTVINADGQRDIPIDTAILLYQALGELLVNVFKHAEADLVNVGISDEGTDILLTVRDNGKGFDVEQILNNEDDFKGYGLFSIQERLESIHGRMTIQSTIGAGTEIVMSAPMKAVTTKGEDE